MANKPNFNKAREMNMRALKENPEARNSDWSLLFEILKNNGVKIKTKHKDKIMKSGLNLHTMLRERRRIQSEGLYIPTNPEVAKKRKLYQEYFEQNYSK